MSHSQGSVAFSRYAAEISETDVLDPRDLNPVLLGLYGEVGGIMATAKKHVREGDRYPGYAKAALEEFGDTLWYLAAICRRLDVDLAGLFDEASAGTSYRQIGVASDLPGGGCARVSIPVSTASLDTRLFKLGRSAASLLDGPPDQDKLVNFARDYLEALNGAQLVFSDVVQGNLRKARGAFVAPDFTQLPDFDGQKFGPEEQLPRNFAIRVNQRPSGKTYLQWHGVFIGDPLTDNIGDPDGYRFHDVFHLANAAILHWSPVMRALIKHKRKSIAAYDEAEDGGRAIVVEEGVTAWIFAQAKDLKFFDGQTRVSLGLLKTIGEFVKGFEVDKCPLKLWERSILQGYAVFREIRAAQGGWIIGDRAKRTLSYQPPGWTP
ncbi:MAG: nucleoside triphosphate pyrophosphohydrolase family protein [Ramlibacter sp.]|nr:nucleoside triphosphate pyrophosphohydrolase family protein [Ramlibacter sp.]